MKQITKYGSNCSFYDQETGLKLKSEDILTLIQRQEPFQVISYPGNNDITAEVKAHAIYKWAKNRPELAPVLLDAFMSTKVAA